jgi:hypothetical protein
MANLNFVHGAWINLDKPGGQVFFVGGGNVAYLGKGRSDGNSGLTPLQPLATIAAAVSKCENGRGDTIALMPGTVTLTSTLTIGKTFVTLAGIEPVGSVNSSSIQSSLAASADTITVSEQNVTIENIHFKGSTAANTAIVNAGATNLTIRNCTFICSATNVETITVPAGGSGLTVEDCRFTIVANGPDAAIEVEAAGAANITIQRNTFLGGSATNQWDVGAINSGAANTECLIRGNVSTLGPAIILSAAATGVISDNHVGGGTLGSMIDPGSCMCFNNFEADAIDQSGRLFPDTVAS